MARMIPNLALPDRPVIGEVYGILRDALDDNHVVYQRLADDSGAPDFWIRHMSGRSLFLAIVSKGASAAPSAGEDESSGAETADASRRFNKDDLRALLAFRSRLLPDQNQSSAQTIAPLLIIVRDVSEASIRRVLEKNPGFPLQLAGREALNIERLRQLVGQHLGRAASPTLLAQFRHTFSPEAVVPPQLNPHTAYPPTQDSAREADALLDYQQEQALKNEVSPCEIPLSQADVAQLRLLNGVAGSGKSLILLYRVRLLRNVCPEKSVLALVHSKPVARDLEARYRRLNNGGRGAEWQTFYQWCRQFVPGYLDMASDTLERELASDIVRVHLSDTRLTPEMLLDEIHFYKDRLLFSLQDYLDAQRNGQGFQLSQSMRKRVFVAMRAFDQRLNSMRKASWHDLPRLFWDRVDRGLVDIPQYDHILVDEAQFFAPIWFELIKRALKPETGHLMMAADPSQGFLHRRRSWLSAGLDVRGRTTVLRRSYRSTQAIMRSAVAFLERRGESPDGDEVLIPTLNGQQCGEAPQLHLLKAGQSESEWGAQRVAELVEQGVSREDILILPAGNISPRQLSNRLNRQFGSLSSIILCDDKTLVESPRAVRICSLAASSGLEAAHVIMLGAHEILQLETAPDMQSKEREQRHAENTRLIYTGITRAAKHLDISVAGDIPDCFQEIGFELVSDETASETQTSASVAKEVS